MRFHILTQFAWPDDAPTGLYAEQVADALGARGRDVMLVAGEGSYRKVTRPAPRTPIKRVHHARSRRGNLLETLGEYFLVERAFSAYVKERVDSGDVVVVTSAPPSTVFLHRAIESRGARSVYWLQDYYPELVRGLAEYPRLVRAAFSKLWDRELGKWDRVVKAAGNLGYEGGNSVVIRNWPTLDLGPPHDPIPKTALYSGNLGYGHDVDALIACCARLRDDGYRITVRGDGPGMRKLPAWIEAQAPKSDLAEVIRGYWDAEVHLVAAHPKIVRAVFPSKIWNSLATGRRVITSGFAGPMAEELEKTRRADWKRHASDWCDLLEDVANELRGWR